MKKKVLKTENSIRKTLAISIGGENRYFNLTVTPIYKLKQGSWVACISNDVTELQKVEKKLE